MGEKGRRVFCTIGTSSKSIFCGDYHPLMQNKKQKKANVKTNLLLLYFLKYTVQFESVRNNKNIPPYIKKLGLLFWFSVLVGWSIVFFFHVTLCTDVAFCTLLLKILFFPERSFQFNNTLILSFNY